MAQPDDASSEEGSSATELVGYNLPALPGEQAVAVVGNAIYSLLPDGARKFVNDNLSLKKPDAAKPPLGEGGAPIQPAVMPNKENEMARLPTVISGASRRAEEAAAKVKPKMSKLDAAKAAAGAVGTAGTAAWGLDELMDYAKEHYPDAYGLVSDMFGKQGVDVESNQIRNGSGNTRANVLAAFARSGVDASFSKIVGLSSEEQLALFKMITNYDQQMVASVDAQQDQRITTGDVRLDGDLANLEIADVCAFLGLTGPRRAKDLYKIVRVVQTLTEPQVEAFERHERMYGRIKSRGLV